MTNIKKKVILLICLVLSLVMIFVLFSCDDTETPSNDSASTDDTNTGETNTGDTNTGDTSTDDTSTDSSVDSGTDDSSTSTGTDNDGNSDSIDDSTVDANNSVLTFVEIEGGYAVSDCKNEAISVEIPSVYNGKPVLAVNEKAFYECFALKSVTIPNSVKKIEKSAFEYCLSLESITLPFVGETPNDTKNASFGYIFGSNHPITPDRVPKSLKNVKITGEAAIAKQAFINCSSIVNVEIANGTSAIGEEAFFNCSSLVSISIPGSVIEIGKLAFAECKALESVYLSKGITTIGGLAFDGCRNLKSIVIPDTVTTMRELVFNNCSSIVIYCEPNEKPSDWYSNWNMMGYPVEWGYKQ